jgi:16S rRNA (cytidine1402-2'-O)-methyltransferase
LIFFESPHRIAATLAAAADVLGGDRKAAVCRELTKTFEEFRRGTLSDLAAHYETVDNVKGEIVLVVGPPEPKETPEADIGAILADLSRTLPTAKAATEAARLTGLPRKGLYQRLLDMKNTP